MKVKREERRLGLVFSNHHAGIGLESGSAVPDQLREVWPDGHVVGMLSPMSASKLSRRGGIQCPESEPLPRISVDVLFETYKTK
jgi:hypothetical protein